MQVAGPAAPTYAEATLRPATKLSCETLGPVAAVATFHREPKFTMSGMSGIGSSCRTGAGEPLSMYP